MTVRFSHHVLNRHIAPGIDLFDKADIPDMSQYDSQSEHWVDNHFLNSVAGMSLTLPVGAYVQTFLRRAEGAFYEHALARDVTHTYFASDRQSPSTYAKALLHWEFFVGQAWQGYNVLIHLIQHRSGDERFRVFQPNDGSTEQRLNSLYNAMKHAEGRITSGQILADTVSPIWLSNRGMECTDDHLAWSETGDILRDLSEWAGFLVDPSEMATKLANNS